MGLDGKSSDTEEASQHVLARDALMKRFSRFA
jgi:hypothetical protein